MLNLDKEKTYLLACSYGPDSMALFNMLLAENYIFSVAHVNYNIRPESKKETEGLEQWCSTHQIQLYKLEVEEDIGSSNVEAKCRDIRYKFFKDIYDLTGSDFLLVAHNQDDLIETYYLQKNRKNLVNCYGISRKTCLFDMNVIRPLLSFKKIDLLKYCQSNDVPFAIDSTNLLDIYARNKIRHEIVEKMTDDDRKKIIEEIDNKNKNLEQIKSTIDSIDIHCGLDLISLEQKTYLYAINKLANEAKKDAHISRSFALEILNAIKSEKPNVVINIKDDFMFVKEYNYCSFCDSKFNESYSFMILEPCVMDNDYFYLDFTKNIKNRNVTLNDYPLTIRTSTNGDKYTIKDYLVDVRRLFIDWKMPISLRKRWPLICNKDGKIIYIPRYQKDFVVTSDLNFFVK